MGGDDAPPVAAAGRVMVLAADRVMDVAADRVMDVAADRVTDVEVDRVTDVEADGAMEAPVGRVAGGGVEPARGAAEEVDNENSGFS